MLIGLSLTALASGGAFALAASAHDGPRALAAAGLPPGSTPRTGRYAGPSGEPISFRVAGGHVRTLRMHTSCGLYTVASIPVHRGDFQARTGPAVRPLQLYGRFTSRTHAQIDWSVGYTATVTPTCLLHDTWSATRRGP